MDYFWFFSGAGVCYALIALLTHWPRKGLRHHSCGKDRCTYFEHRGEGFCSCDVE